MFLDENLK